MKIASHIKFIKSHRLPKFNANIVQRSSQSLNIFPVLFLSNHLEFLFFKFWECGTIFSVGNKLGLNDFTILSCPRVYDALIVYNDRSKSRRNVE